MIELFSELTHVDQIPIPERGWISHPPRLRRQDECGDPTVALDRRGSRRDRSRPDKHLRTRDGQEDPERQSRTPSARHSDQSPGLRPDAASGTRLRVVRAQRTSSSKGNPNGRTDALRSGPGWRYSRPMGMVPGKQIEILSRSGPDLFALMENDPTSQCAAAVGTGIFPGLPA